MRAKVEISRAAALMQMQVEKYWFTNCGAWAT